MSDDLRAALDAVLKDVLLGGIREDAGGPVPTVDLVMRGLAERGVTLALQQTARPEGLILPDDVVCACLDETGTRRVTRWERCERCGAFMRADPVGPDV